MTPTETATILRQFNEWRRLEDDALPYSEVEIGEAIDAAVEMIERDALLAALRHEADCVESAKAEIEALRAKIAEMEKQEPVAEIVSFGGPDLKEVAWKKGKMPAFGSKLYALPGAKGE